MLYARATICSILVWCTRRALCYTLVCFLVHFSAPKNVLNSVRIAFVCALFSSFSISLALVLPKHYSLFHVVHRMCRWCVFSGGLWNDKWMNAFRSTYRIGRHKHTHTHTKRDIVNGLLVETELRRDFLVSAAIWAEFELNWKWQNGTYTGRIEIEPHKHQLSAKTDLLFIRFCLSYL